MIKDKAAAAQTLINELVEAAKEHGESFSIHVDRGGFSFNGAEFNEWLKEMKEYNEDFVLEDYEEEEDGRPVMPGLDLIGSWYSSSAYC